MHIHTSYLFFYRGYPLAGRSTGDCADLLQHAQGIVISPTFHYLALRDVVDDDPRYGYLLASRRNPHKLPLMRATPGPAGHYRILFGGLLLDGDTSVGEGTAIQANELFLAFGPDREVGKSGVMLDVIGG